MIPKKKGPWCPPSSALRLVDGLWRPAAPRGNVSYPDEGNDFFEKIEHASFWFQHRNHFILEAVRRFFSGGYFYDIGGGNGIVAQALEGAGVSTVVIEPGRGALHAKNRGLPRVIQSTLEETCFREGSLDAVGCFDVMEHLEEDALFCRNLFSLLKPQGSFFCTVPAGRWLWSEDDVAAGHFRRYSKIRLESVLREAGFKIHFTTHFFCWMALPLFFVRSLPTWFRFKKRPDFAHLSPSESGHLLPKPMQAPVSLFHDWELARIQAGRSMEIGTSLLVVAMKPAEASPDFVAGAKGRIFPVHN